MNQFMTLLVALASGVAVHRVFNVSAGIVGFAMLAVFAVILFRMWDEQVFDN